MITAVFLVVGCSFFTAQAASQIAPLDTLFVPNPCFPCDFGWDIYSTADADGVDRFISLEWLRPPDGAAYIFEYSDDIGRWSVADSLGSVSTGGGLGQTVGLALGIWPSLAMLSNGGDLALWRYNEVDSWEPEALLEGIIKGSSPEFGSSFSGTLLPSGEELVFVGAQNGGDDPTGGSREGSAYAFVRQPGRVEWVREQRILAPDGVEGDEFGAAVKVVHIPGGHPGDALALIGAPGRDTDGMFRSGAAYSYVRDGSTGVWSYEATLEHADPNENCCGDLGGAVDGVVLPEGDVLALLGSPRKSVCITGPATGGSGAVYVWRRSTGGVWTEEERLCAGEPRGDLRFGFSLDLDLTEPTSIGGLPKLRALVGTSVRDPLEDHPGAAYLFERNPSTEEWEEMAHYETGADSLLADRFGWSVALAGDHALVGAPWDDTHGFSNGAVYVFNASFTTGTSEAPPVQTLLRIYPNPATDFITIDSDAEVQILDVLGRVVLRANPNEQISISSLTVGVYLVRAGHETQRFTVVR